MEPYQVATKKPFRGSFSAVALRDGAVLTSTGSKTTLDEVRQLDGFKLPNHAHLIASGQSATTPMSAKDTVVLTSIPATCRRVWDTRPRGGYVFDASVRDDLLKRVEPTLTQSGLVLSVEQALSSKFYGIYQTGPQTDLGIIAAELGETVAMLRAPFKQLVKRVRDRYRDLEWSRWRTLRHPKLKRLPIQRRRDFAKQLWHEQYLQAYFGYLPFMSEIEGIITDLIESTWSPRLVQVRVTAKAEALVNARTPGSGFYAMSETLQRSDSYRYRSIVRGAYQAVLNCGAEVYSASRFDSRDVLPGLWEAVPYSWLVDYIFNVGHVLSAEQSAEGLEWAWLSRTDTQVHTQDLRSTWLLPNPTKDDVSFTTSPGRLVLERKKVNRYSMSEIPPPHFGLRHKPQDSASALAAVASVLALRVDSLREVRRFNKLLDRL